MLIHQYILNPSGIDDTWKHEIQLFCYLYYNPDERARLKHQISTSGEPEGWIIHIMHPCLTTLIGLRVGQSDYSFQFHLKYHLEDQEVKVPAPIYLPGCASDLMLKGPK